MIATALRSRQLAQWLSEVESPAPESIQEAHYPSSLGTVDGYPPGLLWPQGGDTQIDDDLYVSGFTDESQLAHVRAICRYIARKSPYAINGQRNRVNYIVGTGHTYKCVIKKGLDADPSLAKQTQEVVDQFCFRNKWKRRQKETRWRIDRDGECLIRKFRQADGAYWVRFAEPGQLGDPTEDRPAECRFGIETAPLDVETIIAYWIDGERIPATDIQHRKENVDSNVRRGCPLFWSVIDTLKQVRTVRRNMSAGSAIQTSVAYVREMDGATQAGAEAFRTANSPFRQANYQTGRTDYYEDQRQPGRILTTNGRVKYSFPFSGVDYSNYVAVIADNLREVASLIGQPEFMLTSDASNANYSSTMVAEGPAVKGFESYQSETADDDLELLWDVIRWNIECGILPEEVEEAVEVQVGLPQVQTRDHAQQASVRQIEKNNGILSAQTWSAASGYDYDQEQQNIQEHGQRTMELGLPPLGMEPELADTAEISPQVEESPQAALLSMAGGITGSIDIFRAMKDGSVGRGTAVQMFMMFYRLDEKTARALVEGTPDVPPATAPAMESLVREDCGTGAGGFKPGNTCPKGGGGGGGGGKKYGKSKAPVRYAEDTEDAEETEQIVGSVLKKTIGSDDIDEVASATGALDDAEIEVDWMNEDTIVAYVKHPDYEAQRRMGVDLKGKSYIENREFWVNESAQGKGIGSEAFGRQVEYGQENGISYIKCHAARANPSDPANEHNGYYTWPRMGYDQSLDDIQQWETNGAALAGKIRSNFPEAKSVLDVMETKRGRDWWKENGTDLHRMRFDLTSGSRSLGVLEAYQNEREKRKAS